MSLSSLSKTFQKLKNGGREKSNNNTPISTPTVREATTPLSAHQPLTIATSFDDDIKDIYKIHEDECIDVLFTKDDSKLGIEIKKYQPKGLKSLPIVTSVVANSPAQRYGVTSGDLIIAVNGKEIASYESFREECATMARPVTIKFVKTHPPNVNFNSTPVRLNQITDEIKSSGSGIQSPVSSASGSTYTHTHAHVDSALHPHQPPPPNTPTISIPSLSHFTTPTRQSSISHINTNSTSEITSPQSQSLGNSPFTPIPMSTLQPNPPLPSSSFLPSFSPTKPTHTLSSPIATPAPSVIATPTTNTTNHLTSPSSNGSSHRKSMKSLIRSIPGFNKHNYNIHNNNPNETDKPLKKITNHYFEVTYSKDDMSLGIEVAAVFRENPNTNPSTNNHSHVAYPAVVNVIPNSCSERYGVKYNDVIAKINGVNVESYDAFTKSIQEIERPFTFGYSREIIEEDEFGLSQEEEILRMKNGKTEYLEDVYNDAIAGILFITFTYVLFFASFALTP